MNKHLVFLMQRFQPGFSADQFIVFLLKGIDGLFLKFFFQAIKHVTGKSSLKVNFGHFYSQDFAK